MPVHDGGVDSAGELSPSLRQGGAPCCFRRAETPLRLLTSLEPARAVHDEVLARCEEIMRKVCEDFEAIAETTCLPRL
ncbi:hypothetical protein GCM10010280_67990 [Streptomyces pilosus]|uniref:Uncharacterized protein n=1 Tax=Streptomyces pilosus TaxID=28893 RepID=A0A918F8M9_9ACTN|nr:hypothetical protein GCM10010280_67990 [Streptomyces pilosus]